MEKNIPSSQIPDWSREKKVWLKWDPARSFLASIRLYQTYSGKRGLFPFVLKKWAVLAHRFWGVVTGADIPLNTKIEGGLLLPHPNGIVIHPAVSIGPNCLIFQQVTIGVRRGGVPHIGGHVDIGAGAKILGNITIGNHVEIGANAVVLTDVPDNSVAVGVPALIRPMSGSHE